MVRPEREPLRSEDFQDRSAFEEPPASSEDGERPSRSGLIGSTESELEDVFSAADAAEMNQLFEEANPSEHTVHLTSDDLLLEPYQSTGDTTPLPLTKRSGWPEFPPPLPEDAK